MGLVAEDRLELNEADRAVGCIRSGMRVFLSGNCGTPQRLLEALVRRSGELTDVEIAQVLTVGSSAHVAPEMQGHFRVNTMFIGDTVRQAVNDGRADFTPCRLSEIPTLYSRGFLPIDVAMIQVSPPDGHGYCSFGVEVGVTKTATNAAKVVIAEVNPNMPRTLGDSFIHMRQIDHVVPVDYPLPEMRMGDVSDISLRIGRYIADLIEDGSTLQLGIGSIPNSVLQNLGGKRDLGIHTELFSDGVIDLYLTGVITNERKSLHPGKIVAGFLLGSQSLYRFVDNNPAIEMHPSEYVNDPFVIAKNDRMVAINSAIEIDLTGQVCADSIGTRFYSGVGGQLDFVRGAARSRGGKAIIALPSTVVTSMGKVLSRIMPTLKPGAGVVTTRNDVRYVVTEYGVADLFGKSVRQRAAKLIDIAHPDHRAWLEQEAIKLRYF